MMSDSSVQWYLHMRLLLLISKYKHRQQRCGCVENSGVVSMMMVDWGRNWWRVIM